MATRMSIDPTDLAARAAEQHPGWLAAAVASIAAIARELTHRRRRQPDDRVSRLESRMDIVEWEQEQARNRAAEDREQSQQRHRELLDRIDGLQTQIIAVLSARRKGD